jgi:hypothetical protein
LYSTTDDVIQNDYLTLEHQWIAVSSVDRCTYFGADPAISSGVIAISWFSKMAAW